MSNYYDGQNEDAEDDIDIDDDDIIGPIEYAEDFEPSYAAPIYDDDIVAEQLDEIALFEGGKEERANAARAAANSRSIRTLNNRVKSNAQAVRRSIVQARRIASRQGKFERRYRLDERRERRAIGRLTRQIREIEEQRELEVIMGMFSNRIVELDMTGADRENNPKDTYEVHGQTNDMMGMLMPMLIRMMGPSGGGGSSMIPMMMMMMQGGQGGQGNSNLMLPMMMMLMMRRGR